VTTRKTTAAEAGALRALRDYTNGYPACPGTESAKLMLSLEAKGWVKQIDGLFYHFLNPKVRKQQ